MKKLFKKVALMGICLLAFFMLICTTVSKAAWDGKFVPYTQVSTDMRAVWVATVGNLNIDRQLGTDEAAISSWKNEYIKILDNAEANHFNTIVFQVRPANDAFYPSKYNPWSEYLAGYGVDPGWDPLEWMIEVTHNRGLEYHAWLNPYRASTGSTTSMMVKDPATGIEKIKDIDVTELNNFKDTYFGRKKEQAEGIDNPVFETGDELHHNVVLGAEDLFVLNPASEKVRNHVTNTIMEIVENYDIDGIHFDDYFYPNDASYIGSNAAYKGYTFSTEPWVDMADYEQYVSETTTPLNIYDWRRENVNKLIKQISDAVREKNNTKEVKCAFGISPASRWAPTVEACSSEPQRGAEGGMLGSCNNYYSYSDLFADTLKWAKEEWIDYITPQNYTHLKGDYDVIAKWWSNALKDSKTKLYMGTALYQVKESWGYGLTEMYYQVTYNSAHLEKVEGYFIFSYSSLLTRDGGLAMSTVAKYAWKYNALTPLYGAYTYDKKVTQKATPKNINIEENQVSIKVNKVDKAKGYGIYEFDEQTSNLDDFVPSNLRALEINPNKELTFTKNENKVYALVTFDQDNSIYEDVEWLVLENNSPTVDLKVNKNQFLYDEEINVDVTIEDDDSDYYYLTIIYSSNGSSIGTEIVKDEKITSKEYRTTFKAPRFSTNNGKIIVIVKDIIDTVQVDAPISIKSAPPVVTLPKIDDFHIKTVQNFKVTITDDEQTNLNYKLYISVEDGEYELIDEGKIKPGELTFNYSTIIPHINCKFKLVVSDNDNQVEVTSNTFNITKLVEPDDPGDNDPDIEPEPEVPTKPKGCNCKKNIELVLAGITIITCALFIIRKRD